MSYLFRQQVLPGLFRDFAFTEDEFFRSFSNGNPDDVNQWIRDKSRNPNHGTCERYGNTIRFSMGETSYQGTFESFDTVLRLKTVKDGRVAYSDYHRDQSQDALARLEVEAEIKIRRQSHRYPDRA
ncbi:hypothetical protein IQ266_18925 [filamentous cyanobacterium LEGE 11480]|uniref:Uncharacterized protein n=1 Tax=Romeriopsis navalis LEGE 11480 TaxID=2777977 RepID=A0A928VQC7_9CYAN|nr:hypothetical protein [Romeriopsis navalis]MBE9031812.1 hypothetical protein [Romeriopsis navalis LEGE 11480]